MRLGRDFGREHPGRFESEVAKGQADEVALICYTSGTTGSPKGVMLTHANAVSAATLFAEAEDVRREDEWLAYLPMAWVGDAIYTMVLSLLVGFTVNCPESPQTVQRDLRELGPTAFLAPPRIWESMLTTVQVRAADATRLKRWVFRALPGHRAAGRDRARRGQADADAAAPGLRAGGASGLPSGARPARAPAHALVLLRRRTARWRDLPLLPFFRCEPEADLRLHRALRSRVAAGGWRGRPEQRRPTLLRASRSRSAIAARCWSEAPACSRATSRTMRPPARSSIRRVGSTPVTQASSIPAVIW